MVKNRHTSKKVEIVPELVNTKTDTTELYRRHSIEQHTLNRWKGFYRAGKTAFDYKSVKDTYRIIHRE